MEQQVGKFKVDYCYSESFVRYRLVGDEDKWAESSGYAVIYCKVSLHNLYVGDLYIHKAEMMQYIGDEDINFLSPDFDGFAIVDNMIKTGWFEGYFLSQFENISDNIKNAVEILYNINHAINLLESIGITIDGSISDSSLGSDLYESATNAYRIIEKELDVKPENFMKIVERVEKMYQSSKTSDNKNLIITECIMDLMKI